MSVPWDVDHGPWAQPVKSWRSKQQQHKIKHIQQHARWKRSSRINETPLKEKHGLVKNSIKIYYNSLGSDEEKLAIRMRNDNRSLPHDWLYAAETKKITRRKREKISEKEKEDRTRPSPNLSDFVLWFYIQFCHRIILMICAINYRVWKPKFVNSNMILVS